MAPALNLGGLRLGIKEITSLLSFLICKLRRLDQPVFKALLSLNNFLVLFPEVRCAYFGGIWKLNIVKALGKSAP